MLGCDAVITAPVIYVAAILPIEALPLTFNIVSVPKLVIFG